MKLDPAVERQRLSEHYGSLIEEELCALMHDAGDLTEIAQQALRDELARRGLSKEMRALVQKKKRDVQAIHDETRYWGLNLYEAPPAKGVDEDRDRIIAAEYTWKTKLCECETEEQAWLIAETLRRAGIEAWVQARGLRYPRISVAADQLEQARVIASQPIPAEVIAEAKRDAEETPESFKMPICQRCGAGDPFLMAFDPINRWKCGACGEVWADEEMARQSGRE